MYHSLRCPQWMWAWRVTGFIKDPSSPVTRAEMEDSEAAVRTEGTRDRENICNVAIIFQQSTPRVWDVCCVTYIIPSSSSTNSNAHFIYSGSKLLRIWDMAAVWLLAGCCSGVHKQCWQRSITMLQNCGWELEHGTWNYSDCATTLTFRGNLSVPNWAEQSGGVLYSCKLRWLNKHSFSRW